MKKDASHTIKRAQRFPVILIGEGLLAGAAGGLLVLLYRVALTYAGKWLELVLSLVRGNPLTTMTDERDAGYVHDKMEKLCYTSF